MTKIENLSKDALSLMEHFVLSKTEELFQISFVPDRKDKNTYIDLLIELTADLNYQVYHGMAGNPWTAMTIQEFEKLIEEEYSLNLDSENFTNACPAKGDTIESLNNFYDCLSDFIKSCIDHGKTPIIDDDLKKRLKNHHIKFIIDHGSGLWDLCIYDFLDIQVEEVEKLVS